MKKFINKPSDFVNEMLEGIYASHSDQVTFVGNDLHCYVRKQMKKDKVGIITGGGSGHLPLFLGYVGDNMLDGCAVGDVFQSPGADQILEVTRSVNQGRGVLYLYGNYTGDIMNFDLASEIAITEGIQIATTVCNDDVASGIKGEEHKRRGIAGIFFVYKVAAAAAAKGMDLQEVRSVAEKARANVRTMGVAFSPCIIPEVGRPTFSIGEDEMEIGMGIHGEPGIRREKIRPSDEIVKEMLLPVLKDLPFSARDEVCLLINSLGATPKEELYIIARKAIKIIESQDIAIFHAYVGEFATSMEMAGASISLCRLDAELKRLISVPACTPFFVQNQL